MEVIEVPEAVPDARQGYGSKSDSRISESELYKYFEIKAPFNCKINQTKNSNKKVPPLRLNARNTDLTDLPLDAPKDISNSTT